MFVAVSCFVIESAVEKNKQKYTQITSFLRLEVQGWPVLSRHHSSLIHASFLAVVFHQILMTDAKSDGASLIFLSKQTNWEAPQVHTVLLCRSSLSPSWAKQSWLHINVCAVASSTLPAS